MRKVVLQTVIALVACAPAAAAQNAVLLGSVRDTLGRPIQGAEILGLTSRTRGVASSTGWFRLDSLQSGPEIIVVRSLGFRAERMAVTLVPGDTIEIEAVLRPLAQILPEITVRAFGVVHTGRSAEIAKRVLHSGAPASALIARTELDRWAQHDLADVLRRAGLRVEGDMVACPRGASEGFGQGSPNVAVYLDGALIQQSPRVAVDLVPATWLDAIEIYRGPATRPVEYNATGSSCTIALWTR